MTDTPFPAIDWTLVPVDYMAPGLRRYFERGIPAGSFMMALLSNDLMRSFACADALNFAALPDWVRFLRTHIPVTPWLCYGSPEIVRDWIKAGGWAGLAGQRASDAAEG